MREVYAAIERLLANNDPHTPPLIGIDGRCGSGKSTLAAELARKYDGAVFHLDDFYMPFEKRAPDWRERPCANMELDRFEKEVLCPAKAGKTVAYRPFVCFEDRFAPTEMLTPKKIWIAEGSYAFHPSLAPYYDLKIWLTCSPETQSDRLQKREGDNYASFVSTWIPLEEAYAALWNVPESADLIICTDTAEERI